MDCQFISVFGKFVTSQNVSFSRADTNTLQHVSNKDISVSSIKFPMTFYIIILYTEINCIHRRLSTPDVLKSYEENI